LKTRIHCYYSSIKKCILKIYHSYDNSFPIYVGSLQFDKMSHIQNGSSNSKQCYNSVSFTSETLCAGRRHLRCKE